jgi:hypothetical protein
MGTLGGFPNLRPLPATLPTARCARPHALWLRRAKLASAYAVNGNPNGPEPSRALAPAGVARLRQRDHGNPSASVGLPAHGLRRLRLRSAHIGAGGHSPPSPRQRRESRLSDRDPGCRGDDHLLRLPVLRMLAAAAAVLRQLQLLRVRALVLGAGVVALATNLALQGDDDSRGSSHGILLIRFLCS